MDPLLIILDLDETLFYASEKPLDRPADLYVCDKYHVYLRPGLNDFLEGLFSRFKVAIWTASTEDYASPIIGKILPDGAEVEFLWCRDRCIMRRDLETHDEYRVKDLKKIKRKYPLDRVLFVDDTPKSLERQYGNLVAVHPFEGNLADDELAPLLDYLCTFADCPDVRKIEKRGWRKNSNRGKASDF